MQHDDALLDNGQQRFQKVSWGMQDDSFGFGLAC